MNLTETLRRIPDIARYIPGINPQNAKEFVGKPSDPQTKAMRDREEEPKHYGFHGSKLADALSGIEPQIKLYRARVNNPEKDHPEVNEQVDAVYNRLIETRTRMRIAHRIALAVTLCRSMELPDIEVPIDEKHPDEGKVNLLDKRVRVREGVFQRVLDAPPGVRLYWLKRWADEVYRLANIQRGPGILDGSEYLDSPSVSSEPDYGLTPEEVAAPALVVAKK